ATTAATQQFNQMVSPALALAAFNLGNELQLLPNASSIAPALQNALFAVTNGTTGTGTTGTGTGTIGTGTTGTGTTPISLLAALQALPNTSTEFLNAVPNTFSTALSNVTGVLNPFVGTIPSQTVALPTVASPSVFNSTFTGNTF